MEIDLSEWPAEHIEHVRHCPVCGGTRREEELRDLEDRTFGTAPGKWTLQRCLGCRAAYLDPRPDEASIHLAYQNYYTHEAAEDPAETTGNWLETALANGYRNHLFGTRFQPSLDLAHVIAPFFAKRSARIRVQARGIEKLRGSDRKVLDVGCGSGQFLAFAKQMGWQAFGVEPDPMAADVVRNLGVDILADRVSNLDRSYDGFFDAVTLSHVIEHAHDPIDMLAHCYRVLQPGGYLWLETPNIDSVGYEMYGRHWRGLETPRHLVLFNAQSMRIALQRAGFEKIHALPCLDAAKHMLKRSAMSQTGRIAEVERGPLSGDARKRVKVETKKARSIVRRNPERAEFIVMAAHRS